MVAQMVGFFVSGFIFPNIPWNSLLIGIGLAIAFGAVWFTPYWTPILKKPWAWAVLAGSAILAWAAVAFIQIPLQIGSGQAMGYFWSQETIMRWLMLAGIPAILLSGLVQEGAKLVPTVIYWWRHDKNIDPKLGLAIGAVAGMGLGVFEAQWVHNTVFISGWNWATVQTAGVVALAPFWERFFTVAFHIAVSALAGWGLARGWGWQFYLIASCLHGFANYSAVAFQSGLLTIVQVEIFIAVVAALVTAAALWLRWRKPAGAEFSPAQIADTELA